MHMTATLTARGVDMTLDNIRGAGLAQSLARSPINYRRVIWLSNQKFREDELAKVTAATAAAAAAQVAKVALAQKKENAKVEKVRPELAHDRGSVLVSSCRWCAGACDSRLPRMPANWQKWRHTCTPTLRATTRATRARGRTGKGAPFAPSTRPSGFVQQSCVKQCSQSMNRYAKIAKHQCI